MDATTTTTTLATAGPTGQSTSTLKERRKASPERASRDDRRSAARRVGFTEAYAAQTTKTKKATTVAQTQNAPAPAKDQNCKVFLPDNVFISCPITTNFVAFDEQQEVAVGDLTQPPSL